MVPASRSTDCLAALRVVLIVRPPNVVSYRMYVTYGQVV
jgi:hypothetical protein